MNGNINNDQLRDAKKLAEALVSVQGTARPLFALMLDSMLIGAELAEMAMKS